MPQPLPTATYYQVQPLLITPMLLPPEVPT